MSALDELLAIPEAGVREPWFIEPKDRGTASELQRQQSFLSMLVRLGPACDVFAVPNAGQATNWERLQRWKEGARAGVLDLVVTWRPTRLDDRGVFFPEFKDGKKMPDADQMDRLDRYYRMGHGCGVYRNGETLIAHLRSAGAPIRSARI